MSLALAFVLSIAMWTLIGVAALNLVGALR